MFLSERKLCKLQALVKVAFTELLWGNDGSRVLRKAQPVLNNGMFSEKILASPQCTHYELNSK